MTRREIEAELLAWMRDPEWRRDDARFARLALALFRVQTNRCVPYARFCAARGVDAGHLEDWRAIPPVPTGAFKEVPLRGFAAERTVKVFRTSGTTGEQRGELSLDTLELYEASLLPNLRRHVHPDLAPGSRSTIRVLTPSPEEAPDSSLSHMFGCWLDADGDANSGFDVRDGRLLADPLVALFEDRARSGAGLSLCGTAFAFVHLLDELARRGLQIALPEGSRIVETGGFKGRARERSRGALYADLEAALGVPPERIVNQYGMTELGSQFYDSVLSEPNAPRRKIVPPWVRVRLIDPSSGEPTPAGEVGMITLVDLANTGSVAAISTADLGRALGEGDGFEVIGRAEGAEARGCSIAADVMLGDRA